jgi:hypothetical protein
MFAEITLSALGALMVYSGGRKLVRREAFEEAIEAYQPVMSPRLLARGWAVAETAAGLVCLVPIPGRALGLTWVMAGATGAVARRVLQGESHDCGCHSRARPVSPRALVGNTVIVALLCTFSFVFGDVEGLVVALAGIPLAAGVAFLLVGKRSETKTESVANEVAAPA